MCGSSRQSAGDTRALSEQQAAAGSGAVTCSTQGRRPCTTTVRDVPTVSFGGWAGPPSWGLSTTEDQTERQHGSPPAPSLLPTPRLLGHVVDEGTAAEAQLITPLGFVVVQSFHGSLRLSGKTGRWRSDRGCSPGHQQHPRCHLRVTWEAEVADTVVSPPSAGEELALQRC